MTNTQLFDKLIKISSNSFCFDLHYNCTIFFCITHCKILLAKKCISNKKNSCSYLHKLFYYEFHNTKLTIITWVHFNLIITCLHLLVFFLSNHLVHYYGLLWFDEFFDLQIFMKTVEALHSQLLLQRCLSPK